MPSEPGWPGADFGRIAHDHRYSHVASLHIAVSGGVPAHARISDADKAAVFRSDGELSADEWLGRPHGQLGLASRAGRTGRAFRSWLSAKLTDPKLPHQPTQPTHLLPQT